MGSVPDSVLKLVERFGRHVEDYRRGGYCETPLRVEYIDPLFEALGWDIHNRAGYAEAYKDVVHEDAIKIGGVTKAPDYCFRVGGTRKFFLEAKKPSVRIAQDVAPAYQLRRYAWSAKLPLSILTDFEEFAVYDTRIRPQTNDRASVARVNYVKYTEYVDRWDEIASIFSKEAVLQGSFDKYVAGKKKRGTAEVDAEFLKEIENWRTTLARNIALRNSTLTTRQLNFAVQRTIDRLIFLRICEDRGIETYGVLQELINGTRVYQRLMEKFRAADDRYNSGLFHFNDEPNRTEGPDTLTPDLDIDDKVLKDIFRSLYYPQSPYEFSVLPADILGSVYEQFLGKVIHLTSGHRARRGKPEVKKAGGVYYTPKYIVDYIVEHTVGELIEGKKPGQISRVKIVDPACGSGSFLIGAYRKLLHYHRDWYLDDGVGKHTKQIYQGAGGQWYLTTSEKRRILLNNIYGVDIDSQAVEVTKLNLLLRVLENENQGTLGQLALIHERALPDLGSNIKCGNSLIGTDFYKGKQLELFDEDTRYKINAFDWETEFPKIFKRKNPGFDTVIGNPPYGAIFSPGEEVFLRSKYLTPHRACDSFGVFMEKSADLLRTGGLVGMIVQSGWVSSPSFSRLREFFSTHFRPSVFASMPYDVFGAYVDTVVFICERQPSSGALLSMKKCPVRLVVFPSRYKISGTLDFPRFAKTADARRWVNNGQEEFLVTLSDEEQELIHKLNAIASKFSDVSDIQRGVTPFVPSPDMPKKNPFPAFTGTIRRYKLVEGKKAFIRYDESLAEYKPPRYFKGPRLLLRELISRQFQLQATYAKDDFITNKSMQSLLLTDPSYDIRYLLGILNSRLLSWYFLAVHSVGRRDDFPKIVLRQTRTLPFKTLNLTGTLHKETHDRMVELVNQMLTLQKQLDNARTPHEKEALERQIAATDREIDRLVYELYGLTEEEVRIVEESAREG